LAGLLLTVDITPDRAGRKNRLHRTLLRSKLIGTFLNMAPNGKTPVLDPL